MALQWNKRKIQAAGIGAVAACVMIAAAFFSLQLGLMVAGFISVFAFSMFDNARRQFWQNSISFKLKKIEDGQEILSAQISRTNKDVTQLKEAAAKAPRNALREANAETFQRPVGKPSAPQMAPANRPGEKPTMPMALRAGEKPPAPKPKNYEDFSASANLSDHSIRSLLRDASNGRVEMFLQPIMRLPQRKPRYYEMFARIRSKPGVYIPAARYMKIALENLAIRDVERALLVDCLDLLAATENLERAAPFFINVTPTSLKSAMFMKKLISFIASHRKLADRLIFEIAQKDFANLEPAVREIMKGLAKLGCAFSIDNVTDINFNVENLQAVNVRFIKLNAQSLLTRMKNENAFAEALRVKRRLENNGISIIVEKIENERDLKELLDFDISYGQGYLFSKPDSQSVYEQKNAPMKRRLA